jgi:hypothetical protein
MRSDIESRIPSACAAGHDGFSLELDLKHLSWVALFDWN